MLSARCVAVNHHLLPLEQLYQELSATRPAKKKKKKEKKNIPPSTYTTHRSRGGERRRRGKKRANDTKKVRLKEQQREEDEESNISPPSSLINSVYFCHTCVLVLEEQTRLASPTQPDRERDAISPLILLIPQHFLRLPPAPLLNLLSL